MKVSCLVPIANDSGRAFRKVFTSIRLSSWSLGSISAQYIYPGDWLYYSIVLSTDESLPVRLFCIVRPAPVRLIA